MTDRNPNEPAAEVLHWLSEISACKKREEDYRKEGERILEIYSGKKKETTPFNILYSNTETLLPAVYSAVPRPVVQRRFKDADPMGKSAADAGERVLEFLVDTNVDGYETFDEGMRAGVLDALLPGRGVTCVKYDAEVDGEGENSYKKSELVCLESRAWNKVYFGYAKKWSKVPWIAYEDHIDKDEAIRLFGEEVAAKIVFMSEKEEDEDVKNEENRGERKTACVFQIWDKADGRKVRYISPSYKDGYLKVDDDPLQLTGFFNCPKPIQFLEKSNDLLPVSLYMLYENQATELNRLTRRINKITDAIKARGAYDTELGETLANIMKGDDNELVPTDKSSSLAAEKGLGNAIWFMPIDQLIAVLMQLIQARESCKQVIYEITGIADIMRGASNASETLGAQQIKQSWGTLRLKRIQKEVQRYSRDLLRMMLEVAATKFSAETWAVMTGLPFLTDQQKAQRDQLMSAAKQAQAQGQQISPETQQQIQQMMSVPTWADVLALLKNDMQRAYRIDIETNSTVEPEAVEDQKNITELMTAIGQYLNGVGPLVAQGILPFQTAQSMLLAITRRFRFGNEIEDQINQMQPPKPQDGGKEAEQQAMQAQMQQQAQIEQGKMQLEQAKLQSDVQGKADELQNQKEIENLRMQYGVRTEQVKAESAERLQAMKLQAEAASKMEIAKLDAQTKLEIASMQALATEKQASIQAQSAENQAVTQGIAQINTPQPEAKEGPKEEDVKPILIKRGPDGKAVSVNGRSVIYDENGRLAAIH
jgi:hypothetical protein